MTHEPIRINILFAIISSSKFLSNQEEMMAKEFQQLNDEQWELIHSLMDLKLPPQRGVPRSDLRKVWNS